MLAVFGSFRLSLGNRATLIAIKSQANVWWGCSWWDPPVEATPLSAYLPPHGIFDAQCFLIWTSHSASLEQATSLLGVTAHASCTRCTSLAPTPMFEKPLSKLQHGLSSSAANVKETTGLPTGCFTLTRASPDDRDRYMRLLLPKARYSWTRYCMLMDT